MHLTEKHVIARSDPRFAAIDAACFASKNLYNAALYELRHAFFTTGTSLTYPCLDKQMQTHEAYRALPAKVAQHVLKQVCTAWSCFWAALRAYRENPAPFVGRPQLPKYLPKTRGRNLLVSTMQAVSRGKRTLDRGIIQPSGLGIQVKTRCTPQSIVQVRVVPKANHVVVEVVYEQDSRPTAVDPQLLAGLDPGLDNLATLTSNKPGFVPVIVNGRGIKSCNQYYNKRRAQMQRALGHPGSCRRIEELTTRRNRRIELDLHTASRFVIDLLVAEGIGTLIIGHNPRQKQAIRLGTRTNQHFVQIPHARFIQMLQYKAELVGIRVMLTEESYTSKASLLDLDPLPVYRTGEQPSCHFRGTRIERGLYRAADGRVIHADVNGAGNIIRKVAPRAFERKGVEDGAGTVHVLVVHPVRMSFPHKPAHVKILAPVRIR